MRPAVSVEDPDLTCVAVSERRGDHEVEQRVAVEVAERDLLPDEVLLTGHTEDRHRSVAQVEVAIVVPVAIGVDAVVPPIGHARVDRGVRVVAIVTAPVLVVETVAIAVVRVFKLIVGVP